MVIHIAENIRRYRKERGLTQERLAEVLGVTVGAVSKWESAASTPDLSLIVEMANFFETSVDVLLGYDWHSGSLGETLTRVRSLRNEKRFDEATTEVEKALEKYPNSFEVAYQSALFFYLKGTERKCKKSFRRSLTLLERSLELIGQNDDPQVNEWSIRNQIAVVHLSLGQIDSALEGLKQNNVDGLNNREIGFTLATAAHKPDEAAPYLINALIDEVSHLMRTTQALSNLYEQTNDYASAKAVLLWMNDVICGLSNRERVSYVDKLAIMLLAGAAVMSVKLNDRTGAKTLLTQAKRAAERYDCNPSNSFAGARFCGEGGSGTAFDDFGSTAAEGIRNTLAFQDGNAEELLAIWKELENE